MTRFDVRPFAVYVARHDRPGRKPLYMAYTYWFDPSWKCGRMFTVYATSGTEAKKIAIAMAKDEDARALGRTK